MILKLLYNNTVLLENMMRRFSTKFDELGFSRYVGFNYFIKNEIEKPFEDFFIRIMEKNNIEHDNLEKLHEQFH